MKLLETLKQKLHDFVVNPANATRILGASWLVVTIAVLLTLTACNSYETQLPANLATRCPDAPVFDGQTLGDLMAYTVQLLNQYHECQTRVDYVVVWDRG